MASSHTDENTAKKIEDEIKLYEQDAKRLREACEACVGSFVANDVNDMVRDLTELAIRMDLSSIDIDAIASEMAALENRVNEENSALRKVKERHEAIEKLIEDAEHGAERLKKFAEANEYCDIEGDMSAILQKLKFLRLKRTSYLEAEEKIAWMKRSIRSLKKRFNATNNKLHRHLGSGKLSDVSNVQKENIDANNDDTTATGDDDELEACIEYTDESGAGRTFPTIDVICERVKDAIADTLSKSPLFREHEVLKERMERLLTEKAELEEKRALVLQQLSVYKMKSDPKALYAHCGIVSFETFRQIHDRLTPFPALPDSASISSEDQLFMALVRMQLALQESDLAMQFNMTKKEVVSICGDMFRHLSDTLSKKIFTWPTRLKVDKTMSLAFRQKCHNARVLLTIVSMMRDRSPASIRLKALIGLGPDGQLTFVSQLFPAIISDGELVKRSGILNMSFSRGDSIAVEEGFEVGGAFSTLEGVTVITLSNRDQRIIKEPPENLRHETLLAEAEELDKLEKQNNDLRNRLARYDGLKAPNPDHIREVIRSEENREKELKRMLDQLTSTLDSSSHLPDVSF